MPCGDARDGWLLEVFSRRVPVLNDRKGEAVRDLEYRSCIGATVSSGTGSRMASRPRRRPAAEAREGAFPLTGSSSLAIVGARAGANFGTNYRAESGQDFVEATGQAREREIG